MSHPCKKEETGVCCGGCTKFKETDEKQISDDNTVAPQEQTAQAEQPAWKYQYTMQG